MADRMEKKVKLKKRTKRAKPAAMEQLHLMSHQESDDKFWCDRLAFELREGTRIRVSKNQDEVYEGYYELKQWFNDPRHPKSAGVCFPHPITGEKDWSPILRGYTVEVLK